MWPRALLKVALRGPGKALFLASALGWMAMAWLLTGDRLPHAAMTLHAGHGAAATATHMPHMPGDFTAVWLAMVMAMAPPLLLREVGHLWRTSLRRLRPLTIAWFVGGYVGIWMIAGVALSTLCDWVTVSSARLAVAVALIVFWHCSPARQRCLNACHRLPALRVFGTAAQLDALRFGLATGCYCAATCGLVMLLVMLVKDHHLMVMAAATAMTTFERHLPARRPGWQLPMLLRQSPDWPNLAVATHASSRA
jgi:predicted metal-binding membrane protein